MAKVKFQDLLDKAQGNAYPAMIEHLANQLGVSADSLTRLALGFVPVVEFKKGSNYDGWWAIAERDADAEPVGLSLRHSSGSKVMYPGSHHGCIYEVSPNHTRGERGYSAGAHNWIRTMDAGMVCPICGKPDGCVVSSENISDPKAVICIRISAGAKAPMKMGYLHIRKPEGDLKSASALADNGGPIVVVEGMSDTAAAMDLGFNGLGRPSDKACMTVMCELARGRSAIVVGENDKKKDGREPGREGMVEAFQMLRRVCKNVTMVMPPEHVKDLRAWKSKHGLTRDQFLAYVEEHGQKNVSNEILQDERPLTAVKQFTNDLFTMGKRSLLRYWRNDWYLYRKNRYDIVSADDVDRPLPEWANSKFVQTETAKGDIKLTPVVSDTRFFANIRLNLKAYVGLESNTKLPSWINGATGPDKDLIVFANGILDTARFLEEADDSLMELTPDLFSTVALPMTFDPTAQCPQWLAFLESVFEGAEDIDDRIRLIQQWMGYCMTTDMSMQKVMFFKGPPGGGKGTIMNVMQSLMGDGQWGIATFQGLIGEHGLAPFVGKLGMFFPELTASKGNGSEHGWGLIESISGGDAVQINQKFRDQIAGLRLICRITMSANEFPEATDAKGAMLRRLLVVQFPNSFANKPDQGLLARLLTELSGIANWALAGLRDLRQQGYFTTPASSVSSRREWELNANPTASFLDELTDQSEGWIAKSELMDVWEAWSRNCGVHNVTRQRLMERVLATAKWTTNDVELDKAGNSTSVIRGLSWKSHVFKRFLGRPQ